MSATVISTYFNVQTPNWYTIYTSSWRRPRHLSFLRWQWTCWVSKSCTRKVRGGKITTEKKRFIASTPMFTNLYNKMGTDRNKYYLLIQCCKLWQIKFHDWVCQQEYSRIFFNWERWARRTLSVVLFSLKRLHKSCQLATWSFEVFGSKWFSIPWSYGNLSCLRFWEREKGHTWENF